MKKIQKKNRKPNMLSYLVKYKWAITIYLLLTLVGCALDILITLATARALEQITYQLFTDAITTFLFGAVFLASQRITWYILNIIYYKYSTKIMSDLNLDLAKQAFKLNSKTYNDHDTGTFVQRIVEDPAQIVDNLAHIVDTVMTIITSLIMLIYILTLNLWIAILMVAICVIAAILEKNRVSIRRRKRWIVRRKSDFVHSLTTEIVRSEKDIKSLGLEKKLSEVSKSYYEDYRNERYKMDVVDCSFWSLRNIILHLGVIAVLVFGVWQMDKGMLTLAAFMIVYSNKGSLWDVVFESGNLANIFISIKVCHKRMFQLFDQKEFITEDFGTLNKDNVIGHIEFKNVSYKFVEYEQEENLKPLQKQDRKKHEKRKHKKKTEDTERKIISENQIFTDLSFEVTPNTTVAFVGRSGSGKSTILNLMSKMYKVDSGEVLIDGININDFDKETLRKTISLVNQFPYIFDMTIKENLLLAKPDATDNEIDEAIKKGVFKRVC